MYTTRKLCLFVVVALLAVLPIVTATDWAISQPDWTLNGIDFATEATATPQPTATPAPTSTPQQTVAPTPTLTPQETPLPTVKPQILNTTPTPTATPEPQDVTPALPHDLTSTIVLAPIARQAQQQ